MSDLIRRQDAIDVVAKLYKYESDRMTALQEIPTVEAKPVINGEWIKEIGDIHSSGEFVYCSNCGQATFIPSKRILSTTNFRHFEKPNFCPNCGADMRGEING